MVFAVAVLLVVGAIVFTLFVRKQDLPEAPPVSPTAHLEQRKAQIYENLRDLQFEFRVGKLSDADYQKTKLDLQRELAKVSGRDRCYSVRSTPGSSTEAGATARPRPSLQQLSRRRAPTAICASTAAQHFRDP